jgi:hypothetical protein
MVKTQVSPGKEARERRERMPCVDRPEEERELNCSLRNEVPGKVMG